MRGELLGVWPDTWREIWAPLSEAPEAPIDLFCELYRELVEATRPPTEAEIIGMALQDSLLSREAFHRALILANAEVGAAVADQLYDIALLQDVDAPTSDRREALESAICGAASSPIDAHSVLFRALKELVEKPERRDEARQRILESTFNDPELSKQAFRTTSAVDLIGERVLVDFFETAHDLLEEIGGDGLSNRYFVLLEAFAEKYSLRYQLRRPCQLCPTLPGVFAALMRELRGITSCDPHLDMLMKEFEGSVRDLRTSDSEGNLKSSIQKQLNLIEALGRRCPGVTQDTIGRICDEVGTWPHAALMDSMKNVYRFSNKYPGIRHGGDPATAIRTIEMKDFVAVSILLAGFSSYFAHDLQALTVYRGR